MDDPLYLEVEEDRTASEIVKFYADSTVLITGGTGFLGQVFIEKLLRSCPDLRKIFVVIRPKKGKDVQTRLAEIFDCPIFENLKRKDENFAKRVHLIAGDLNEPNLGISSEDQEKLISQVDVVIHSAATVRFDEKLKTAININLRSTRDLIEMAKKMKKLRAMLHISTAFSHCTRTRIDEVFYDVPIDGMELIHLAENLNEETLEKMTPIIIGDNPNTYVLTKAAAENIVKTEGGNLPIAVLRPSIITPAFKEPLAGWVDNIYSINGVIAGVATGVFRNMYGRAQNTAETVPCDFTVNCALSVPWDIATVKTVEENDEIQVERIVKSPDDIPIYNFVSEPEAKVIWADYMKGMEHHCYQVPSKRVFWYPLLVMRSCIYAHLLAVFFYQTVPTHIADVVARCIGKKPWFAETNRKLIKFSKILDYFMLREWTYKNGNVQNLWQKMNSKDKATFEFSMANFDWDAYYATYARGMRVYILKDPMDTLEEGRAHFRKLKLWHYSLLVVVWAVCLQVLWTVLRMIF